MRMIERRSCDVTGEGGLLLKTKVCIVTQIVKKLAVPESRKSAPSRGGRKCMYGMCSCPMPRTKWEDLSI